MFHLRLPSRKQKHNLQMIPGGGSKSTWSDTRSRTRSSARKTKAGSKNPTTKPREFGFAETETHTPNSTSANNVLDDVLSIEGVLETVLEYLPWKQRHRSCTLVSKFWSRIVMEGRQLPQVLRIEDPTENPHDQSFNCNCDFYHDDEDKEETIRYPLHAIGRLPSWVAARTTKLVLILRFAKQHASKYDLNDFLMYKKRPSWFLDRFPNLQHLTILSEFASDQFVSILSPPSTMNRGDHVGGISSLKMIQYEETNLSNWRHSYLRTFIKLAPNLESLRVRENMQWEWNNVLFKAEDICELLPLSNSLKELVLFNRPNIGGNFEEFRAQMPLLHSWDIHETLLDMGESPKTGPVGRVPHTFEDNAYREVDLNENPHFSHFVRDEVNFVLTMQSIFVPWFLGLDDVSIHPWKNNISHMVIYLDVIMREYFEDSNENHNFSRPVRPYQLPKLANLLEVDTSAHLPIDSVFDSQKHASYCCASRNKTKLQNYHRVVKPCMELYHDEFFFYCNFDSGVPLFGVEYSQRQKLRQRRQLKRLVRRISRVEDRYRKRTIMSWFGPASNRKDFSVLV